MYQVTPHYDFNKIPVELPTCMFKMASIHEQSGENKENPELVALECRQEAILHELKSLEIEVISLAAKFVKRQEPSYLGNTVHDIVIYANPSRPPYSTSVLFEMLKRSYKCRFAVHVHSSVPSLPDGLLDCLGNGVQVDRDQAQVSLTFIWKDVSHGPIMMVDAPLQTPIHGEANIARYINRLLSPDFDTSDIMRASSVDRWLDTATSMLLNGSSKEKAAAVKSMNSHLGKVDWLAGLSVSVADAVCWSAVRSAGQATGAPANVQKWLKACAADSLFTVASKVLS